ncbi:MAG: helix-turn-helix domain-containing protein [Saezia sp.]
MKTLKESKSHAKAAGLSEADFKQIIGVKKSTYAAMLEELQIAYAAKHKRRGRHAILALEDILFMSLKYWRQYITQKELSFEFEVGEATVHDWIVWVEDVLVKSGKFSLPGKKALMDEVEIEVVLVDVTESPIERPQKNREDGIRERKSDTASKLN